MKRPSYYQQTGPAIHLRTSPITILLRKKKTIWQNDTAVVTYRADTSVLKSLAFAPLCLPRNTNDVARTLPLFGHKRTQAECCYQAPFSCWQDATITLTASDTVTSGLISFRHSLTFRQRLNASYFRFFAKGKAAITGPCF